MPPIGRPYGNSILAFPLQAFNHRSSVIAAAAVAGAIIAPIAAPAVLGIVGFGAAGPIAGASTRFV